MPDLKATKSTTIRRFVQSDTDDVVEAIKRYVPELPHYKSIKIDENRIRFLLNHSVADESAFMMRMLVLDETGEIVGGVAAYCVTSLLSWDQMTSDIFLFVKPEYRSLNNASKLTQAYKTWAQERKAALIGATQTGGYKPEEMDKFLKFQGFKPIGTMYVWENPERK